LDFTAVATGAKYRAQGRCFEVWPDMATAKKNDDARYRAKPWKNLGMSRSAWYRLGMPVEKPERKKRQRDNFMLHPSRCGCAVALALQTIGLSERIAFLLVAILALGQKVDEQEMPSRRKPGIGAISAGTQVTYEHVWRAGHSSATFAGFASSMRKRCNRAMQDDPEAAVWLRVVQANVAMFILRSCEAGCDLRGAVEFVVGLAEIATEGRTPLPPEVRSLFFPTSPT
jgi:hypothetical protein